MAGRTRGQIIERGGTRNQKSFLIRVSLGMDPATGKRLVISETFRGTKSKAQERLTALLGQNDRRQLPAPANTSLAEHLDRWLDTAGKTGSVSRVTLQHYSDVARIYLKPRLGALSLQKLTPLHVQTLYSTLGEKFSPRTICHVHNVLRLALSQAVEWNVLTNNVALQTRRPKRRKREMQALAPVQARAFMQAAATDRYGTMFVLMLATGMRPGEACGLQWPDIDFDRATVTVQRSLARVGDQWFFTPPKTDTSVRTVPLPLAVVAMLREHRKQQAAEKLAAGYDEQTDSATGVKVNAPRYRDNGLVFCTEFGLALERRNLSNRHFKPILKAAALPSTLRIYDLRHSCATLLGQAGEHPKVIAERLGHASTAMTMDVYSHVLKGMQEQATEKLGNVLFGK